MERIGVVNFDDIELVANGWSSIDGGPAQRISGIGDLTSSVYWVTNLPYKIYRQLNLNQKPNLFDSQFFRTSLKLISMEVGLEDKPKDLAEFASEVFSRVNKLSQKYYKTKLNLAPYRFNVLLSDAVIGRKLRQRPMGSHATKLVDGFKESTQQNQSMLSEVPKNSKARTFYFPRGAYAKNLFSQDYPIGTEWKQINEKDVNARIGTKEGNTISGTKSFIQSIDSKCKNKSAIFKVDVVYTDKFFRKFSSFGVGSNYQRNWMTLPELKEFAKFCVIEVEEGYLTDSGKIDLPLDFMNDDYDEFSYSRGLFLENIWTAYSLPINRGEYYNPTGAYMRAYDRLICSKAAFEFARNNFTVGSFGTGRVVVYLREAEESIASEIALELGLICPHYILRKD
jgi:hypothetical protein